LVLTSLTNGGRSVGIARSRTKAKEFGFKSELHRNEANKMLDGNVRLMRRSHDRKLMKSLRILFVFVNTVYR
jgi:hypothetical protein